MCKVSWEDDVRRERVRTSLLSSFRRAISAALSSLDIPAVLCTGAAGAVSPLPPSDGVGERAMEDGLGLARGDDTPTRELEVRNGFGARVACRLSHSPDECGLTGAGAAQGFEIDVDPIVPKPSPLSCTLGMGAVSNAPTQELSN